MSISMITIPIIACLAFGIGYLLGHLTGLGDSDNPDAYIESKLKAGKEIYWKGYHIYPLKGHQKEYHYAPIAGAGDDGYRKVQEGK